MGANVADSATRADEQADLRYLDAGHVHSPLGGLRHLQVLGADEEPLGEVDGVLIDPAERRLRFFVVASNGTVRRRFLLPIDVPARMDADRRSLQLEADVELGNCAEFTRSAARDFTDDDLLAALFSRPA
jgi:hypothetical protein